MEIVTCTSELPRKAGAYLNTVLREYEGRPILLLLSGGSALSILEYVDFIPFERDMTVSVLDERFTTNIKGNNFAQVKLLLKDTQSHFLLPFSAQATSPSEAAKYFEASLRNWRSVYPDGVIIATIGMGPDGHTAGIFPMPDDENIFTEKFVTTENWIHGYTVSDTDIEFPQRVTVTAPFLQNEVNHALVYISNKDEKIHELMKDIPVHKMPAQIVKKMKRVTLMTDTELI